MRVTMIVIFVAMLTLSAWTDNSHVAQSDQVTHATISPVTMSATTDLLAGYRRNGAI